MITQSKCCVERRQEVLEPLRAEQLRRVRRNRARPAAPTAPARCVLRTASLAFALPTSTFDSPGSCGCSNISCTRGLPHVGVDRAARAGRPAPARPPGCVATSVLPSPGPVLVTTSDRAPSSADENSTLVRMARNASAKFAGTPSLISGSCQSMSSNERRHHAEERQPEVRLDLVGRLDAVVEVLEEERQAAGQRASRRTAPSSRFSAVLRRRPAPRGVSAASTTRMLLVFSSPRDAGLLRALHQAVVDLPVALRRRARARRSRSPLRFSASASPFCCVERGRQALLLRQRRLVFVLDRLDDLGDLALQLRLRPSGSRDRSLTMSGWLSPSFSDSCACCRCRSASSPFCCWMNAFARIAGNVSSAARFVSHRLELVVQRLLLDPLGLGARHRGVQVGQLLHDDVLRSSSEMASFCSRYRCSVGSACSTSLRCSPSRSPSQSVASFDAMNLNSRFCSM